LLPVSATVDLQQSRPRWIQLSRQCEPGLTRAARCAVWNAQWLSSQRSEASEKKTVSFLNVNSWGITLKQEVQLSQRSRATLRVVENFAVAQGQSRSYMKLHREQGVCISYQLRNYVFVADIFNLPLKFGVRGHLRSLKWHQSIHYAGDIPKILLFRTPKVITQ